MAASPLLLPLLLEISDPAKKTGLSSKTLRDLELDAAVATEKKKKKTEPLPVREYATLMELLKDLSEGELKGMAARVAAKSVTLLFFSFSFSSFFFFFFFLFVPNGCCFCSSWRDIRVMKSCCLMCLTRI